MIRNNYKEAREHQDAEEFQKWINENRPEDKMLWKGMWSDRVVFLRDQIIPLFGFDYKLAGVHYSKSILNPVIWTKYKGVEIIWQYNFYDWQIMVKSDKPIIFDNEDDLDFGDYLYYQGIPEEYRFKNYDAKTNNKCFAVSLNDKLIEVWAFAICLKRLIDRNQENDERS